MLVANPTVLGTQFLDAATAGKPQFVVTFDADVGATLSADDVHVVDVDTGTLLSPSNITLTYRSTVHAATIAFNTLPNGNYRAALRADSISANGLTLDGNHDGVGGDDAVFTFSSLRGDVNHDGHVDASDVSAVTASLGSQAVRLADGDFTNDGAVGFDDLLTLARHYGQPARRPSDGDANGDGVVSFDDLLALAKQYGHAGRGDVDGDGTITPADVQIVQTAADAIATLADWPTLAAGLAYDTGVSASDGVSSNVTVDGVAGAHVATLRASLDAGSFVDVTSDLQSAGDGARGFSFDRQRMASLFGGALADGVHVLHLRAFGAADAPLAAADLTFTLDTAPPSSVSIASPAAGAAVSGLANVQVNALDSVGIDRTALIVDGVPNGAADATAPYALLWDTSVLNGSHALRAIAYDLAGNATTSAPVSVIVGNRAATLTLNGGQRFQTIDGLGVNLNSTAWHNGEVAPEIDTLIDQMGASAFRVIIESVSGWEDVNDDADPQTYNHAYYDQLYATPKFTDLWNTIAKLNARGATVLLNVMGTVPTWLGGTTITNNDEYAEMLASMLDYAIHVAKVHVDAFSDMNEQDIGNPEGPSVGPSQYRTILDKLETRLIQLGIADQVPLLAGETAEPVTSYVTALFGDALLAPHLRHASFHNYFGSNATFDGAIAQSGIPGFDWWVTEYADAFFDGDKGTPVADEWAFSKNSVRNLLNHLAGGASGAMVYDGIDAFYQHHGGVNSLGQIEWDPDTNQYSIRKRMYANGLIDRFVRPGMVRIGSASSDGSTLQEVSFLDPASGKVVIVGMNTASTAALLNVTLNGVAASGFQIFATDSRSLNATSLGSAGQNGSTYLAAIPADTMFALVSTPGTTPATTASPLATAAALIQPPVELISPDPEQHRHRRRSIPTLSSDRETSWP